MPRSDAAIARQALSTLAGHGWHYLPELFPAQREIYEHPARFKVVACGRRWGKTASVIHMLGQHALAGGDYAYFAPTYKLLDPVWRELKRALGPLIVEKSESNNSLTVVGGGRIECWHLQDESVGRGRKYDGIFIDEAAWAKNLGTLWNGPIRPTLTDKRGWAVFLSTPRGRNYFYQLFLRGKRGEEGWYSWRFPTSANPYIVPEEIEDARRSMPEMWFQQEYMAEFISDTGMVFRNVRSAVAEGAEYTYNTAHTYVMGIDWGKQEDYTAAVVIDVTTAEVVYVSRLNKLGWERQRAYLAEIADYWHPEIILAEENSIGDPNIEELQKDGLPVDGFRMTAFSKNPLIDRVALAIERGKIALIDDEDFLTELESYSIFPLPGGGWRYSAPEGAHDDYVVALALAYHAFSSATEPIGAMWTVSASRGGW